MMEPKKLALSAGNIALFLYINSTILPLAIYAIGVHLFQANEQNLAQAVYLFFLSLITGSTVLGISGWKEAKGKVASVLSITTLVIVAIIRFYPA